MIKINFVKSPTTSPSWSVFDMWNKSLTTNSTRISSSSDWRRSCPRTSKSNRSISSVNRRSMKTRKGNQLQGRLILTLSLHRFPTLRMWLCLTFWIGSLEPMRLLLESWLKLGINFLNTRRNPSSILDQGFHQVRLLSRRCSGTWMKSTMWSLLAKWESYRNISHKIINSNTIKHSGSSPKPSNKSTLCMLAMLSTNSILIWSRSTFKLSMRRFDPKGFWF